MLRVCLIAAAVGIVALVSPSRGADSPFNVDFFCGWSGCYRPMEWTPVEIGISSQLSEPFAGSVIVSARQDGFNTMNVTQEFVLTPDFPLHLPLVTKLAFGVSKCTVKIIDAKRGRTRWRQDFDLWDFSARNRLLTDVSETDLLIGVIGSRKFGLLRLAKQSICKSARGSGKVYVGDKLPRMVPWDWPGFVSLDLLILYDPDWTLLNRYQLAAITQWVSNGGRLLLVLGSNPLPADSAVARFLPFEVKSAKQISISGPTLADWGLNADEPETVTCWPLAAKPEARICRAENMEGDECLFGTGYVDFGRLGVLAFDPSTLSDKQKAYSAPFWVRLIKATIEETGTGRIRPREQEQRAVEMTRQTMPSSVSALTGDLTHPDRLAGGIEVTFAGLEAGKYRMTSWHNNPQSMHSPIDICVNGAISSRNNPQSQVHADEYAAQARTEFSVSDSNRVVIEFRPVASEFNRRAVLCGFELFKLQVDRQDNDKEVVDRIFGVDFGAEGQQVAEGFVPLGLPEPKRSDSVRFYGQSDLPEGVSIALKPTNTQDDLQFNPTQMARTARRASRRIVEVNSRPERSIEYVEDAQTEAANPRNVHEFRVGMAQAASNAVMQFLSSIPEMRPLSIWWVILLLTALAFLLGPVDYKLLKRLDRLPLTWMTCSFWIILFTVGAYYGVQALRGGKMQLRVISVLDGIENEGRSWSTSYSGLFAPYSADYRFDGLESSQWWSGLAPTEDSIYVGSLERGSRQIYCYQHDGGNLPYSVPVNIWTMQFLLNESAAERLPFQATVVPEGAEITVTIVNDCNVVIREGYVLLGDNQTMKFDGVPPHETKQFRGRPVHDNNWERWSVIEDPHRWSHDMARGRFEKEKAFFARGCLQRTRAVRAYLAHGAAVVCVEYDNAPVPSSVKGRSCAYDHVQLVRLVVFPEESATSDGPAYEGKVSKK
ncbi:MAG: hypothetical protein ACYTBJ_07650 [Planctomycetota bacterium]|jgi:hypothetical protein